MVEILRRNMQMVLKKSLFRERFRNVDDMIQICTEYEKICKEEEWRNRRHRVQEVSFPMDDDKHTNEFVSIEALKKTEPNSLPSVCWKDIGHAFYQCKLPQKDIFCFWCGQDGVLSANCIRCAETSRKSGTAAVVRSSHLAPQPHHTHRYSQQPHNNPFSKPPPPY